MDYDFFYDDAAIVSEFREKYETGKGGRKKTCGLPIAVIGSFRRIIYGYFNTFKRDFPWRHTDDPYHILVAEIMLQQTQVRRVEDKYREFIRAFPTLEALAAASLRHVIEVWQGMGYNRRARYLYDMALYVIEAYSGKIPDSPEELIRLPGIGRATASSISAFAFNKPVVFIETNIRTVFIHFFFHSLDGVSDREIIPLVEATLDKGKARLWYSALMDYGAMLKKRHLNPSRRSAHHQKQSPFEGSRRQVRGLVLKALLEHPGMTMKRLAGLINKPEGRVSSVLEELMQEGLIKKRRNIFYI